MPNPKFFIEEFQEFMRQIRPVLAVHNSRRRAFVCKEVKRFCCKQVFLCNKTAKSLERPYSGPHEVFQRIDDRVFKIRSRKGEPTTVSVENLKPAFVITPEIETLVDLDASKESDTPPICNPAPLRTYSRSKVTFKT